jgi:hypothetical protein
MYSVMYQKIRKVCFYPGPRRGARMMERCPENFEEKMPEIFALENSLLHGFRL